MKKEMLKALKVARKDGTNELIFEKLEIVRDNELATYYKEIKCDTIDIQERYINNVLYDFIIDDEYLLNGKSQQPKNAVAFGTRNGELLEIIFGNYIICGIADDNGKETDLNDDDIENILSAIQYLIAPNGDKYQAINYTFEKEYKH